MKLTTRSSLIVVQLFTCGSTCGSTMGLIVLPVRACAQFFATKGTTWSATVNLEYNLDQELSDIHLGRTMSLLTRSYPIGASLFTYAYV